MHEFLRATGARMPAAWKHRLVRWRWRFDDRTVSIEAGARLDWRTRFGRHSAVAAGASINYSDVGRYTYFGENSRVVYAEVGSFCSVAPHSIIGGGTHPTRDWVSTSPRFCSVRHNPQLAVDPETETFTENLRTVVGHDVWIGYGAIVLPGVKVGHGAVVGAGAVVTRDVAPYQVVAGVPAKPVRSRFSEEEVAWLLESAWWEWDERTLDELAPNFSSVERLRKAVAQRLPPSKPRPAEPSPVAESSRTLPGSVEV